MGDNGVFAPASLTGWIGAAYWDEGTTGRVNGAGSNEGTISSLTGDGGTTGKSPTTSSYSTLFSGPPLRRLAG